MTPRKGGEKGEGVEGFGDNFESKLTTEAHIPGNVTEEMNMISEALWMLQQLPTDCSCQIARSVG